MNVDDFVCRNAMMKFSNKKRLSRPVILSAAKDLRSGRANRIPAPEILRCAQDDIFDNGLKFLVSGKKGMYHAIIFS
jgi:hypothetical protein